MGRNILVNKEHDIYVRQPRVSDIVDLGEDYFHRLATTFTITTESLFAGAENEDELIEKFKIFDLFFLKGSNGKTILDDSVFNGKQAIEVLQESLSLFLNVDEFMVLENRRKIVVNNSYIIDINEFNKIRKIVQDILGRKDIEIERAPKEMSKRQEDIWRKLQRGRRRKSKRDAVYMQDIINFTSFGGSSYIPLTEIDKMTYFQLHNAYKSIIGKDAYLAGMQYKLSQKFDVKDEVKHWSETIKIGK